MISKPSSQTRGSSHGFTLPELLIVSVIGSVLLIGAAELILAHVRTTTKIEGKLRSQDVWTRIQFLLDQEIQESACSAASSGELILTLPPCGDPASPTITYRVQNSKLVRIGPAINSADGTLLLKGGAMSDVVAGNVSAFVPSSPDGKTVSYKLNILDPSGFRFTGEGKASSAQTRSRIIDN